MTQGVRDMKGSSWKSARIPRGPLGGPYGYGHAYGGQKFKSLKMGQQAYISTPRDVLISRCHGTNVPILRVARVIFGPNLHWAQWAAPMGVKKFKSVNMAQQACISTLRDVRTSLDEFANLAPSWRIFQPKSRLDDLALC